MSILVLRIKKSWFDEIASGKKTFEFRADTPRYSKVFDRPYKYAIFHYQKKRRLLCRVNRVEKLPNELSGPARRLVATSLVWRIELGTPIVLELPTELLTRLLLGLV